MGWQLKTAMPTARDLLGAAALNGIVYCAGGNAGGNALTTHEAYDTSGDSWSTKAAVPTGRYGLKMAAASGYVFAFGGHEFTSFPGTVIARTDRYDPLGNSWTGMTAMPNAQEPGCAILVSGVVYVIGGNDVTRAITALNQAYSVAGDSWTAKTAMTAARTRFAAFAIGQYIYCAGGLDSGGVSVSTVYRYDTVGNSWATMTSAAPWSGPATGTDLNGFGYAVPHGSGGIGPTYKYNSATDTWTTDASVNQAHSDFAMATADTMYKFGGALSNVFANTVERYGASWLIGRIGF